MASIDFSKLIQDMLGAAKTTLATHWNDAKPYVEKEIKSYVENIRLIDDLKTENRITEEQAKLYLDIQRSSMRIVLLTIEGLGILAVEATINAVIDVIRNTVNTAIGWNIL